MVDMSTDAAWEEWGCRDPYFGVFTAPKYRRSALNEQVKLEFFESGRFQVEYVLGTIRKHLDPQFQPRSVLDFGCGVGRMLAAFAAVAQEIVGLDVSQSMLQEARRNCDERGATHVRLLRSDDTLSSLLSGFDLIHSCIVFQHIPVERGTAIFSRLLQHLNPGGVGAVQLTYSKAHFGATHGIPPVAPAQEPVRRARIPGDSDPEIQMNPYNMNSILFLLQQVGVTQVHAEFTDHGGELGMFLFFKKPPSG
jgi:SAM-dependent methyltransferase